MDFDLPYVCVVSSLFFCNQKTLFFFKRHKNRIRPTLVLHTPVVQQCSPPGAEVPRCVSRNSTGAVLILFYFLWNSSNMVLHKKVSTGWIVAGSSHRIFLQAFQFNCPPKFHLFNHLQALPVCSFPYYIHLLKVISVEIAFNAITLKIDVLNPAESHIIFNCLTCRGSIAWEPGTGMDNSFFTLFKSCGVNPVCGTFVKLTNSSVLLWLLPGISK